MARSRRRRRRRSKRRPALPGALRGRTNLKIRKLITEGKGPRQAAATAYSMARKGKLGPRGGYLKRGRRG